MARDTSLNVRMTLCGPIRVILQRRRHSVLSNGITVSLIQASRSFMGQVLSCSAFRMVSSIVSRGCQRRAAPSGVISHPTLVSTASSSDKRPRLQDASILDCSMINCSETSAVLSSFSTSWMLVMFMIQAISLPVLSAAALLHACGNQTFLPVVCQLLFPFCYSVDSWLLQ